ncbi:hypothetical protein CDAR_431151 [Caerostris darwini]|uniref:BPTI/Kunitz inhibitor domain-containing protein n=1 Tax=Caerostris darwini TaxID=1538125 RepID=A0AAV4WYF8_9ARAC|nr:hypothetical protein CDAR_431151 [Caerostris darwini]
MKSSIPLLLLLFSWIASFCNCDRSYRIIEKTHNNGKQDPPAEDEQCMDEMRKACGASECCRKLFQLDESHAKRNATEQVTEEEEDEDEMESGSSPSADDYPGKKGIYQKDDDESWSEEQKKRKAQDCKKPKRKGPCLDALIRFFYHHKSRSCKKFTYGGCFGNDNNFETKEECEKTCMRNTRIMKSSIPLLLLLSCWMASFGSCDVSYRIIEKIFNNGKHDQKEEQCMDEMRKACEASACCRKLFQLDESHAKSNEEQHVSKMEDEDQNTEGVTEEEVDEYEKKSGSSPSGDDYPGKKGLYLRFKNVKQIKRKGRVLELYPGKDEFIRLVKLRTEKGNILRPIQRLYPLELTPNYQQVVPETQKVSEVVTEYSELNPDSYETARVFRQDEK